MYGHELSRLPGRERTIRGSKGRKFSYESGSLNGYDLPPLRLRHTKITGSSSPTGGS